MAISLLVNSVWQNAAVVRCTDSSDVETSEMSTIGTVTGGPRHLYWSQSGTAARRIVYIKKSSTMSFDSLVMVRADRHVGHSVAFRWWSNYTSTSTDISTSTNWAPTLIGRQSQDHVVTGLSVTTAEAAGVVLDSGTGGAYTKKVHQLFFCSSFTFPYSPLVEMSPAFETVLVGRQNYLVQERYQIVFPGLTSAQVNTLQGLYKVRDQPCFFYDSDAKAIIYGLLHCIITGIDIKTVGNDLHNVTFQAFELRHYT